MRDLQHWKDKVELSLDGRQLFFLFFGGAIAACMLFALGVMTGRRLEARAIAVESPSSDDPLAQLDQLGDIEDEELTYHRALTKDTRASVKPHAVAAAEPVHTAPKPMTLPPLAPPVATTVVVAKPAIAPKPVVKPMPVDDAPPARAAVSALKADKEGTADSHFTLQLSAFAAKKDADDFVKRVQAAGYHPFVISSDVAGKGVLYRVRVGDYTSKDAALADKTGVEKKLKVAAYLAKI